MEIKKFLSKKNIFLQQDLTSKEDILKQLSKVFGKNLNLDDNFLFNLFKIRENYLSTGIGEGIGIPHIFDDSIKGLNIIIITLKKSVDFNSIDKKPVNIIISIVANHSYNIIYLEIVSHFMKILQYKNIRDFISTTHSIDNVYNIIAQGNINTAEL